MGEHIEVYVGFDTAKLKHAVAIAEGGRAKEVRFLGEIENRPLTIERLIKKRIERQLVPGFGQSGPTVAALMGDEPRRRPENGRDRGREHCPHRIRNRQRDRGHRERDHHLAFLGRSSALRNG